MVFEVGHHGYIGVIPKNLEDEIAIKRLFQDLKKYGIILSKETTFYLTKEGGKYTGAPVYLQIHPI